MCIIRLVVRFFRRNPLFYDEGIAGLSKQSLPYMLVVRPMEISQYGQMQCTKPFGSILN
jgi:hypothetical protein